MLDKDTGYRPARCEGSFPPLMAEFACHRSAISPQYSLGLLSEKNVLGTAIIDVSGDVHDINDYYLSEILGYSREDFVAHGLNLLAITPADYQGTGDLREELLSTGGVKAVERPRYRKDGSIVWTLVGYAAVEGSEDMLCSWALDITEKKRAEMTSQYLLEANKIMASSIELQPLLEKIAAVTLVNGFCDFCTIHFPEDNGNLLCRALIHKDPELTRQVKRIIARYPGYLGDAMGPARVIRTGKSEMSHADIDGSGARVSEGARHMDALALKSYMSVPLFLKDKVIGALTLTSMSRLFDPADLKTAEALALRASQHIENAKLLEDHKNMAINLERSNRDLTYFASIAAHDLKSPLATSQSYLYALLDEPGLSLSDMQRFCIKKAIDSNQMMLSQIDRLLTFSLSQHQHIEVQPVSLDAVVRSAIDNLKGEIEDCDADFVFESLPMVSGDLTLLIMLFQNLFSNSIRYRAANPLKVEIRATESGNGWTVSVQDNGRGFDAECKEKIFRLFEQLPDHRGEGGYGIGLATCRKIIEAHQGKIWAEAMVGKGAKFTFTLTKLKV